MEGFVIPQNNRQGKVKLADLAISPPRTHSEIYEPMEDIVKYPSKDPERSINHILHKSGVYVRVETKYNTDDVDDFGPFHEDLENGQTYVSAIEILSMGVELDRTFLRSIKSYCPELLYTETVGSSTMFRFVHPKFYDR
jgi:hypothetical protein